MAVKHIELPGIGPVTLQKRRGNRSVRISISAQGRIKVTIPPWAPYRMAIEFALTKEDWIRKNKPDVQPVLHKTPIGKAHHLIFVHNPSLLRPHTRIRDNEVVVSLPSNIDPSDPRAQKSATQGAIKALKAEAEQLLPTRLTYLASQHSFYFNSVTIKRLSSRWGSCDNNNNITLNCYLMQLPWNLIDYVLLHELTHTRVMAHGPKFWAELSQYVPNLSETRKEIRKSRPMLNI